MDLFMPNRSILKRSTMFLVLGQVLFVLFFWQSFANALIPKPTDILDGFVSIWEKSFVEEVKVSFILVIEAMLITTAVALIITYATVMPFFRPFGKFITKARFLGITGFSFIFTLWASGPHEFKLMLLTFGMSSYYVTSMLAIVENIPKSDYDYARTLRMSEWCVVYEVVIRGRLSESIEVAQQIFAIGWMMLPTVEGLSRGEGGIGKFMLDSNKHFLLSEIFAIQIFIFVVGMGIDYFIGFTNRLICPYAFISLERN